MDQTKQIFCDCDAIHEEAVGAVQRTMPLEEEFYALSELYKMFSDSSRVRILWALSQMELCVCDLAALLNLTKSAVSHQLKPLRIAKLVKYRREGKVVYYTLNDSHVQAILANGFEHVRE